MDCTPDGVLVHLYGFPWKKKKNTDPLDHLDSEAILVQRLEAEGKIVIHDAAPLVAPKQ